jgi:hypothetical protein
MVRARASMRSTDRQSLRGCPFGRDGYRVAVACLLLLASLASAIVDFGCGWQATDQSYPPSQISLFDDDRSDTNDRADRSRQDGPVSLAADSSRSLGLTNRRITANTDRSGASKAGLSGAHLARGPPGRQSEHTAEARLV